MGKLIYLEHAILTIYNNLHDPSHIPRLSSFEFHFTLTPSEVRKPGNEVSIALE